MGRAFVGQVWDLLQQTQPGSGQGNEDAERLQRLGVATTERAAQVKTITKVVAQSALANSNVGPCRTRGCHAVESVAITSSRLHSGVF